MSVFNLFYKSGGTERKFLINIKCGGCHQVDCWPSKPLMSATGGTPVISSPSAFPSLWAASKGGFNGHLFIIIITITLNWRPQCSCFCVSVKNDHISHRRHWFFAVSPKIIVLLHFALHVGRDFSSLHLILSCNRNSKRSSFVLQQHSRSPPWRPKEYRCLYYYVFYSLLDLIHLVNLLSFLCPIYPFYFHSIWSSLSAQLHLLIVLFQGWVQMRVISLIELCSFFLADKYYLSKSEDKHSNILLSYTCMTNTN